jgi:hypothetical protein
MIERFQGEQCRKVLIDTLREQKLIAGSLPLAQYS